MAMFIQRATAAVFACTLLKSLFTSAAILFAGGLNHYLPLDGSLKISSIKSGNAGYNSTQFYLQIT